MLDEFCSLLIALRNSGNPLGLVMMSLKEPFLLKKILIKPAIIGLSLLKHWSLDIFIVPVFLANNCEHGVTALTPLLTPGGRSHV